MISTRSVPLLSTDLLELRINDSFDKEVEVPAPGRRISRMHPPFPGRRPESGSLTLATSRFIDSTKTRYEEDLDRAKIFQFYDSHFDTNWQACARDYALAIAYRGNKQGLDACFSLQHRYIKHFVDQESPEPQLLRPEGYKYNCCSHFPYRDPILNLEGCHILGERLLGRTSTITGETGKELMWKRILETRDLREFLEERWQRAIKRLLNVARAKASETFRGEWIEVIEALKEYPKNLKNLEDSWRFIIIDDAWNLVSCLHEIGCVIDEENLAAVPSTPASPISKMILGKVKKRILPQLRECFAGKHDEASCFMLFNYFDRKQASWFSDVSPEQALSLPLSIVAVLLASDALGIHNKYLRRLDSPSYADSDIMEVWECNPLAAFLGAVILLAEIPARICWRFEDPGGEGDVWTTALVQDWMPVQRLELSLEVSGASLSFVRDLNQFKKGEPIDDPLKPPRLDTVATLLGPKCMGLLEEPAYLKAKWRDLERPAVEEREAVEAAEEEKPVAATPEEASRIEALNQLEEALSQARLKVYEPLRDEGEEESVVVVEVRCNALETHVKEMRGRIPSILGDEWTQEYQRLIGLAEELWQAIPKRMRKLVPQLGRIIDKHRKLRAT